MPIRTEGSVVIDRNIDDVFEYTIYHAPEWSISVVEDEPLETTNDGVGSTFRCITENSGQRMEFFGTIMKWDPPRMSAVELTGKLFDMRIVYTFEDLRNQTRVTQMSAIHPKGLATKIFFFVMGFSLRRQGSNALDKELASLKRKLEAQT